MPKYRNDHDTPRSIADLDGLVVEPGEEFESSVELHNPLLTPIDPKGQVFNEETFRWEKPAKAAASEPVVAPEQA